MFFETVIPPNVGPGSFSTMKQVMPSSVRAARATMPARSPLVTHVFVPLITYSSPSRRARHEMLRVSLPASGSESDRQPRGAPSREAGQPPRLLLGRALPHDQARGDRVRVDDPRQRHPAGRELLDHRDVRVQVEAEPAVLLGDRDPEQAHRLHLRDEVGRVGVLVLEVVGDRQHLALDPPPHRRAQLVPGLHIRHGDGI